MLSFRQNNQQFSQLSPESRKRLLFFKVLLFAFPAGLAFLAYYTSAVPPAYHELVSYIAIMSVSCNFFPIPTFPFVLYVAPDYPVWLVVLTGSLGSAIAGLLEYSIVEFLLRFDRFARLRENGKYQRYASYFDRFSFRSVMLASMVPLPVDVIRLLAITRKYPKLRFILATFLGRVPRIFLFAYLGSQLAYSKIVAIILLLAMLIFEISRRLIKLFHRVPMTEQPF